MRLSTFNYFQEKWFKLSQTQNDVIMINPGDTGILLSDNFPNRFYSQMSKIRFINSVYNGASGFAVGSGLIQCNLGVWQPIGSAGFIRFDNDSNGNFTYNYTGNFPIEIGQFEIGFSTIDSSLFTQPLDFTPPVIIPSTKRTVFDISDGAEYPMGVFIPIVNGGGRLKEVVMDMTKDPRKNPSSGTPYIYHQSQSTNLNQSIMYNNATFNKSIYTTEDGTGTINVSSGFTGVRFRIICDETTWQVLLQVSTVGAGQIGNIVNPISQGVLGAQESMIFSTMTY